MAWPIASLKHTGGQTHVVSSMETRYGNQAGMETSPGQTGHPGQSFASNNGWALVEHEERIIPLRDGKLQVQLVVGGSGPNLLFLHGTGGFTGWAPYLDRLAESFRVFAPAQPGVASSTGLELLDDLWDLVLFYEELTQELGLERFFLLGHCYGGMVAAELAAHRPDRISRLALVAPLGLWLDQTPTPDIFAMTLSQRDRLEWYDPDGDTAQGHLLEPEDPLDKMERELDRTQTAQAIGKFIWPLPDRGLVKRAHRIIMPTLLLWGESDAVVPPAYAEAFRNLLPNAEVEIVKHCGHLPQLERPEDFHNSLRRFFQD